MMNRLCEALTELARLDRQLGINCDSAALQKMRQAVFTTGTVPGKVEMVALPEVWDPAGTGLVLLCSGSGSLVRIPLQRRFVLEMVNHLSKDPQL